MMVTTLLFFCDFSRKSGLLEYWIRPYVRGHWVWLFSPACDAVKLTLQEVGFICPFVVVDPTDLGATTVVAPGLMLDNFLPIQAIPDAESLPFYPSVLKLVVCDFFHYIGSHCWQKRKGTSCWVNPSCTNTQYVQYANYAQNANYIKYVPVLTLVTAGNT